MLKQEDYHFVNITKKHLDELNFRLNKEFVKNAKSVLNGAGNKQGMLSEILIEELFNGKNIIKSKGKDKYDYDYYIDYNRYDIKSKTCYVVPTVEHEVSVLEYQLRNQKTDRYIFVRVFNNLKKAIILGYIDKSEYISKSVRYEKGFIDPRNNYKFFDNTYNLLISDLKPIKEILK